MRYPGLLLLPLLLLTLTSSYVLGGIRDTNRKWKDGPAGGVDKALVRGVPPSKAALYDPKKAKFECLDGSDFVDFKKVNDDYCDCDDGSDEPGTSACPNGYFYCRNNGYKGYFVPSSWVNDAVCDCCDGSDEYMSETVMCRDNCNELARLELEEAEKNAKLYKEGGKIREELVEKGKSVKAENQDKLVKLRADLAEAERVKKEKETVKLLAEDSEKRAMEKYKPPPPQEQPEGEVKAEGEVEPEKKMEELDQESLDIAGNEAEEYFAHFDSDGDGVLTIAELQTRVMFDKNHDGEVSKEEAMYWLDNREQVNMEEFVTIAWPYIKPLTMKNAGIFKPPHPEGEEVGEEHETHHEEEESYEDALRQEEHEQASYDEELARKEELELEREGTVEREEDAQKAEEDERAQYDEETLRLIDEAKEARERYQEAERAVLDLQSEIRQYEERVERDYGSQDEFAPLDGQCFEHQTQEYIYSLCLFGKATQRSISGGSEVSLGQWNSWIGGDDEHKYTKAKYDRGLTCWNGPARSTIVTLTCGTDNVLVSVSEPNRCEYAMELTTPAACNAKIIEKKYDVHDSSTWPENHDEL